ncbi:MAG: putative secondary metabolism biosynthetic enzyme [Bathelium mastoideum]|nr:MAG: putative secondary metabolism biosynthetic enzyme [Bathelium mastoideum]
MAFGGETNGKEVVQAFKDEVYGKTIIITGPSKGSIGAEAALSLAPASPKAIFLVGRNKGKIQPVVEEIKKVSPQIQAEFIEADLANNGSIRKAASTISAKASKIDIVLNAAGVMATRPYRASDDDIELQFAANHTGHYLLTQLLIDKLLASGHPRVVNLTSMGYTMAEVNFDDPNFQSGKTYDPWVAYGQAKTANILHAAGLTSKYKAKGLSAFAVHPGLILESGLLGNCGVDNPLFEDGYKLAVARNGGQELPQQTPRTLQQGCATLLLAALDPSLADKAPALMMECAVIPAQDYAISAANVDKLWDLSEKLTAVA